MTGPHLKPSAVTVLHALKSAGDRGLTTGELGQLCGYRYSARLLELRDAGYLVSTVRVRPGQARYTLLPTPYPHPVVDGTGGVVEGDGGLALFDPPPLPPARPPNPYEDV